MSEFMTPDETDHYIDERVAVTLTRLLAQQAPRRGFLFHVRGAIVLLFWLALGGLVLAVFYYIAAQQYQLPLPANLAATPAVVFSTPAGQPPAVQSFVRENPLPPIPTPRAAVIAVPEQQTAPPTPTPTPDAHLTAIAIRFAPTETVQAAEWQTLAANGHRYFYDTYTLATPAPAFVEYVAGECQDKQKVKVSFLLQQMCEGD